MQLEKEEQRPSRMKETSINSTYISRGEDRRKFEKVSESAELNKVGDMMTRDMEMYHEDDRLLGLPEEYRNMTDEELRAETDRLYKQMKEHPQDNRKKDYSDCNIKLII